MLMLSAAILGCGQTSSPPASDSTPVSTQTVTLKGVVAAEQSDLSDLDQAATTQSVSLQSSASLLSKFSRAELQGLVKPMGVKDILVALKKIATNGSLESVKNSLGQAITTLTDSSGNYTLENVPAGVEYVLDVIKSSGNKTLQMQAAVYADPDQTSVSQNVTSKTTLVAQSIISKVTLVLETNQVSDTVIKDVIAAIETTINQLIADGTIEIPSMVREKSASDDAAFNNYEVSKTVDIVSEQGNAKRAIDTMKMSAKLGKGSDDLASAKGYIGDLVMAMTGQRSGIPLVFQDALAAAYVAGETASVSEIYNAITDAMPPGQTLPYNVTEFAAKLNSEVQAVFSTNRINMIGESNFGLIVSAFESFRNTTITVNTVLNVPQTMLCIDVIMREKKMMIDPFRMMQSLGIKMDLSGGTIEIVHFELRLVNYMDWGIADPTKTVSCWIDVMDFSGPQADLSSYTATLTYPTASGNKSIALQTDSEHNFGPSNSKNFFIEPWRIKELNLNIEIPQGVIAGTFTVSIKNGANVEVASTTKTIPNVDLSVSRISWIVPTQSKNQWGPDAELGVIISGTKPILEWKIDDAPANIPAGYEIRTMLNIWGEGNLGQLYPPEYTPENPTPPPAPLRGTTFAWPSSSSPQEGKKYRFGASLVLVEKGTEMSVMEGNWSENVVECLTQAQLDARKAAELATITISGTITPPDYPPQNALLRVAFVKFEHMLDWSAVASIAEEYSAAVGADNKYSFQFSYADLKTLLTGTETYHPELVAYYDETDQGQAGKLDIGPFGEWQRDTHPKRLEFRRGKLVLLDWEARTETELGANVTVDFNFGQ